METIDCLPIRLGRLALESTSQFAFRTNEANPLARYTRAFLVSLRRGVDGYVIDRINDHQLLEKMQQLEKERVVSGRANC